MLLIGLVYRSIEKTQAGQFITTGTMGVGACCSRSGYVWRNKRFHICMTTVARYKCSSKPIPSIHSLPAVNICTIAKGCWTVVVKETLLTVYLHRCQRRLWSQKTVPKPLVLQHLEKYANIRDRTRNVTTILSFYLHVPGNL